LSDLGIGHLGRRLDRLITQPLNRSSVFGLC
jgi:hypothetical protein